jgi:hypothetical protein
VVVFSGTRDNATQLYRRSLDSADASALPGTDNAEAPFFSPDGAWIGFFADNRMKKVSLAGGPPAVICDTQGRGVGASWGDEGTKSGTLEHQQFFSVTIRAVSPLQADSPRVLFEAKPGEFDATTPIRSWDTSADGQRFLVLRPVASTDKPVDTIDVVLNWQEELKRLVPPK